MKHADDYIEQAIALPAVGEKLTYEAHGKVFTCKRLHGNTYVIRDEDITERSRWADSANEAKEELLHCLTYGVLHPPTSERW